MACRRLPCERRHRRACRRRGGHRRSASGLLGARRAAFGGGARRRGRDVCSPTGERYAVAARRRAVERYALGALARPSRGVVRPARSTGGGVPACNTVLLDGFARQAGHAAAGSVATWKRARAGSQPNRARATAPPTGPHEHARDRARAGSRACAAGSRRCRPSRRADRRGGRRRRARAYLVLDAEGCGSYSRRRAEPHGADQVVDLLSRRTSGVSEPRPNCSSKAPTRSTSSRRRNDRRGEPVVPDVLRCHARPLGRPDA